MPILLRELARLTDVVAGRGAALAGRMLVNSAKVGGPREQKRALTLMVPHTLGPIAAAMSEGTRQWYAAQPGGADGFEPALLPAEQRTFAPERIEVLFDWASTLADPAAAFTGGIDRDLRNISRDTVLHNATTEGARWYRYASASACGFCRMLATRGAVYASAKAAGEGNRYHDHCHCLAVVVRPGDSYTEMPYVAEWRKDYKEARKAGLSKPGEIANHMDRAPTGRETLAANARRERKAALLAEKEAERAAASSGGDRGDDNNGNGGGAPQRPR